MLYAIRNTKVKKGMRSKGKSLPLVCFGMHAKCSELDVSLRHDVVLLLYGVFSFRCMFFSRRGAEGAEFFFTQRRGGRRGFFTQRYEGRRGFFA